MYDQMSNVLWLRPNRGSAMLVAPVAGYSAPSVVPVLIVSP